MLFVTLTRLLSGGLKYRPSACQYMLSRLTDQRQAISAAETSKSIHMVEDPIDLSQKTRRKRVACRSYEGGRRCRYVHMQLRSSLCVLLRPLPGRGNSLRLVLLPRLSYVVREGVVWVRGAEESLNREQDSPDLERRRPIA